MRHRTIKATLACAALALAAPAVLATAAGASKDQHHSHPLSDTFQLSLVSTDQWAKANTGWNDASVNIDQSDSGSNDANHNSASIWTGDASASNSNSTMVDQSSKTKVDSNMGMVPDGITSLSPTEGGGGGDNSALANTTQMSMVDTHQSAKANTGGNDASVNVDQSQSCSNDANSNSASITTGNASASNSNSTSVTQSSTTHVESNVGPGPG